MRVLLVHNRYRSAQPSGENVVVDDEAALLADRGVDVVRLERNSDDIAAFRRGERLLLPARVVWSRSGAALVSRTIDGVRPDVVHFHNTFPLWSPAAVRAAKCAGVPVVVTVHNFRLMCAAATFLRDGRICEQCMHTRVPTAAVRYGCYRGSRAASIPVAATIALHRGLGTWKEAVDRLLFPSAFSRDKYLEAGWPPHKLTVKYNTARPSPALGSRPGRGFVALSRLSVEKGLDVLIDAWRVAFPNGEETLSIIGSGEAENALRAQAGAVAGIRFLGKLPSREALEVLSRARALVVPSRWHEVFGRTVVEAYAAGVPVIASRVGALPEIVEDGRSGLLVDKESVSELASALRRMSEDRQLALTLGEGARDLFARRFAPDPTMRRLLAVYDEVAAGAEARTGTGPRRG
jgi:glycosyltransferase involved in cell wall biosynthesis